MRKINIILPFLLFSFYLPVVLNAQSGRTVVDLSSNHWKLWLDTAAKWQNDKLYAPPVAVNTLPVNLPAGGWSALHKAIGKTVHLPATVEQYYWGMNGNVNGVSGNYLGVSWFTTSFPVPVVAKGKRIVLQFEAVRFRAEIFVNNRLAGYDLVNSTPFEVDISDYVKFGTQNEIAVRITDPNGNFDWRDSQNFMWGEYRTNPTHGFGGITGKVKLVITDKVYTSDVFIKNKPKPNEIEVQVTTSNATNKTVGGSLLFQIKEAKANGRMVLEKSYPLSGLPAGNTTNTFTLTVDDAKLWSVDSPHLYVLHVQWKGADKTIDNYTQRFGFRWFEVRDNNGDKQFYLNGKRIVLITSISWGFWPVNGMAPSDELAKKQIMDAKQLGMNMLNFHRTIGQQNVLDYADELGLLYFEEPGGNQYPANLFNATDSLGKMQADFYFATRNEKLFRMIKRDRNHPSLIIYNMHNERGAEPQQQDRDQMLAAHKLDETRIITYNSSNGSIKLGPDARFKLHLLPYDFTFRDYGWFDQHHAGGPGTYHDNLYRNTKDFAKYFDHKDEIIYYGEEGAIGTPPRLELIRNEILKTGRDMGWESDDYLKWYDAYDSFLKKYPGFQKAFPKVDSLTRAMGNVAYYYQGRVIENVHISNTVDGYAINGWESMKLENHSGIVDNYRNFKGDPALISRYNQPLYVAVKMNRKVLGVGDTTLVDFFVVNRKNLNGEYNLVVTATGEKGSVAFVKTFPVQLTGGNVYGELLYEGLPVVALQAGYTTVTAELQRAGKVAANGDDKLFAVLLDASNITADGMIADTAGVLAPFLKANGIRFKEYRSGRPEGKYLLVGAFQPQQTGNPLVTDILEWVNEGNTLIVVNNIEAWAAHLAQKEVIDYRGSKVLGTTWYGGNFFSRQHELFNGLPQAQVFNWEYQCFATYNKSRIGLRLFNGEPVVACVADHKKEVYSALSILPHGRGKIILCALDIFSCLRDISIGRKAEGEGENAAMNTFNASQNNKANIVGQQLLLNLLKYAK
jgi:hypothetical protein